MPVLPGPGLLVIIAGLSIRGIEFAWARRLRDKAHHRAKLQHRCLRCHTPKVTPSGCQRRTPVSHFRGLFVR